MHHRVGILGLGVWPREAYLPILAERNDVEIVTVAARSEATRRFAREILGSGVRVVDDFRDVFNDAEVDVVMLALPNRLHLEALEAAVHAGKHLFIEPPVAGHGAELEQAMRLLGEHEKTVHADFELRYLPVIEKVIEVLREGVLGEVLTARVRLCCNWGHGGGGYGKTVEEDGFFFFLGAWYLDLLDVVFAASPLDATVTGGRSMNGQLMDHGWATLRYPGDRIGQFAFSLVDVEEVVVTLEVCGSKGKIEVDLLAGTCRWRSKDTDWRQYRVPCSQPVHGFAGMRESVASFFAAVAAGRPSPSGVDVCCRVHQAVAMCAQREGSTRSR